MFGERRRIAVALATAGMVVVGVPVLDAPPAHADPLPTPAVFTFTGSSQTYVVPDGVTRLAVEAAGGAGALGGGPALGVGNGGPGGAGGLVHAVVPVTPGQTLTVDVGGTALGQSGAWPDGGSGGTGTQGFCCGGGASGGGGGGGSAVLAGATPLLVAAGGGGGGGGGATGTTCFELPCAGATTVGGDGGRGGFDGANGTDGGCGTACSSGIDGGRGGGGATQTSGGSGGAGGQANDGSDGSSSGGAGGDANPFNTGNGGGGGGGGLFGGGGGGASWYGGIGGGGGGGGGGSSFVTPGALVSEFTPGTQAGHGAVAIMPILDGPGATATNVSFSVEEATLPTFPCEDGCDTSFNGSGTATGTVRARTSGATYEAAFTALDGSLVGSAHYTEPGSPFCPANGFAAGSATLTDDAADGVVHRSTTPGDTGTVTGVTVDVDYSYLRVGAVAVIEIIEGTVTVSFEFTDTGPGSFTSDVAGAGLGAFVVDPQVATSRCENPGSLPFELDGDVVLGSS